MQTNTEEKKSLKPAEGLSGKAKSSIGHVVQVIGPTVDVRFEPGNLPEILFAITIQVGKEELVVETAQHLGNNVVRAIALSPAVSLRRRG